MFRTVYDVQLDFALSSAAVCGLNHLWDSLSAEEGEILREKISTLIPDAENEKNTETIRKRRNVLFENIWKQRKYSNRTLLSTIIYVMVTEEQDPDLAKCATKYSCHPLFKTRKCINATGSSDGCCMVFVDESGRVYRNWEHYIKSNILPKGMMIAPRNATYTLNEENEVELEYHLTPQTRVKTKILNASDTLAGVGGVVATVPIAAALAFPVAAPVIAAATTVAFATATYSTMRSAMQLTDRGVHCQSLALTDREARGSWLGLVSGCVGMGATGATKVLSSVSVAGQEISTGSRLVVGSINASSMLLSGTGLANSVYDIYLKINDNEKVCGVDLLQLASSLLIFTHSVNNLNVVSKIGSDRRAGTVRRQLSMEMRNTFEKISTGASSSKPSLASSGRRALDVIRTLNDVPLKDVLMNLHKVNSNLPQALHSIIQTTNQVGHSAAVVRSVPHIVSQLARGEQTELAFVHLVEELGLKFAQHVVNASSLFDVLSSMSKYLSDNVSQFLLVLAKTFIDEYVDRIDENLKTFVATETVVYKIFMHCVKNYSTFSYEFLEGKTSEILGAIEKYFESLNPVNYANKKQTCKYCKGYYYECNL